MRFIVLFVVLLFSPGALALEEAVRFDRLTINDGLSNNAVMGILRDKQGFLWFGTRDGLNRYDGYDFKVFRHDPDDNSTISDNWIIKIYLDANGELWVGTPSGLDKYDATTERFSHFKHDSANPNSLSNNDIRSILTDSKGSLWVGTFGGLNRYDPKIDGFTRFNHKNDDPHSLSHNTVNTIFEDNQGRLLFGTKKGLSQYDRQANHFVHLNDFPLASAGADPYNIVVIYQDALNVIWLGTTSGLFHYSEAQRGFVHLGFDFDDPVKLSERIIWSIQGDANGDLWIGSNNGLNKIDIHSKRIRHFANQVSDPFSYSGHYVDTIYTDDSGAILVGTNGGGVNWYDSKRERLGHFNYQAGSEDSFSRNTLAALIMDAKGSLWLGGFDGLFQYDGNNTQLNHFIYDQTDPNSLSGNKITALWEDSEGTLWVGTGQDGLNKLKRDTGQFEHFRHQPGNANSLSSDHITTIKGDGNGKLWIGGFGGLSEFDVASKRFNTHKHNAADPSSISDDNISAILTTEKGELWVGTINGGLNKYNPQTQEFEHYRYVKSDSTSLSNNFVSSLLEDSKGNLWVGTYGGGLNRFDKQTEKFTHYREKTGLANDSVMGIIEDETGDLWISTNKGLSRFDPQQKTFKNYDEQDGLQGNEFNVGAFFKGPNSEMFFGGSNGFNRFFAKNISDNTSQPPVVLSEFLLLNQSVPIDINGDGKNFTLPSTINTLKTLALSYKESLISFEFSALDFNNPMKNQYAYQLAGWDKDWIYTDAKNRRATYTNIPAGEYYLRVKASNADGYWNEQGKSLHITIAPPPWKTWWAYTLYGCFVLALLFAFVDAQRKKIRNQQQKIADQAEVNLQLKRVDKLKDEFLANTSHELRTPLNGIIGLAESLVDGATGQLPEITNSNLQMIVDSGKRLSNLVNDILDFSKLKSKDIPLNQKAVDLRTAVEVTLTMSAVLAKDKNLTFVNNVPQDLPAAFADEDRLQQILFNLLGNAIKFTNSGSITVSGEQTDGTLSISISDTGIGIAQDKLQAIFESFEQADSSTTRAYGGTGLGLTVTRQLVELHGGTVTVESSEGQGSTFTFTLAMSSQALIDKAHEPILSVIDDRSHNDNSHLMALAQQTHAKSLEINTQTEFAAPVKDAFRVLLVDDEPINLQVLSNHLQGLNYQVVKALNGEEALAQINGPIPFDLVLLDVMMPKMSGYDVAREIRLSYSAHILPIIMLTAKNQVDDLIEGFSSGTNDYLAKPFSKGELLARVKTQLNLVKINAASARFLPGEFLTLLNRDSIVDVRLGDQIHREMTVLFLDIRSFTDLSENMTPKQNFDFLNEYLSYVIPAIKNNGGFIDKYIGDAVMALFPGCPDDAVTASITILQQIQRYNNIRQSKDEMPIAIGIGLHTGNLMLGTIGNDQRMDGTVISDAVNLAARIEGLTKTYGASLVISEQSFNKLLPDNPFHHRALGRVQVKGKLQVIEVIEIIDGEKSDSQVLKKSSLETFEQALLNYYEQDFEESARLFKQVLKMNPADQTAALYHKRSATYMLNGVENDWDGTEKMESK